MKLLEQTYKRIKAGNFPYYTFEYSVMDDILEIWRPPINIYEDGTIRALRLSEKLSIEIGVKYLTLDDRIQMESTGLGNILLSGIGVVDPNDNTVLTYKISYNNIDIPVNSKEVYLTDTEKIIVHNITEIFTKVKRERVIEAYKQ